MVPNSWIISSLLTILSCLTPYPNLIYPVLRSHLRHWHEYLVVTVLWFKPVMSCCSLKPAKDDLVFIDQINCRSEAEKVTINSKAGNLSFGQGGNYGKMSEFFPGMDVRHMDFDHRNF